MHATTVRFASPRPRIRQLSQNTNEDGQIA